MSEIITYKGYKSLEKIEIGDFIYDGRGEYVKVSGIDKHRTKEYSIVLNGLQREIFVGDSEVLCYRGGKGYRNTEKLSWKKVSELEEGDSVCYKILQGNGYGSNNKDLALFLGYFVLYGFINIAKGKVVIHLDDNNAVMEEEIINSVKNLFDDVITDVYTYQGERMVSVVSDMVLMLCSRFGERFENREIIEEVITSDIDFLNVFIKPFYGYNLTKDGNFFIASSSRRLLLAYQRILFRLRKFSNIYTCKSRDSKFEYYALNMNRKEYSRLYSDECWFLDSGYVFIKVKKIQETGNAIDVYQFKDSSYCNELLVMR